MGRPKLTLPLGGRSVIRRLLEALSLPAIVERIVVMRREDEELFAEVSQTSTVIVRPRTDPSDMCRSVEHALDYIRENCSPADDDGWLLSPADHPVLKRDVLQALIDRWRESPARILVPTCAGRRGHPALFCWSLADAVAAIPPQRGLNDLLRQFRETLEEFPVDDPCVLADLDTPDDYDRLCREFRGETR